MTNDISFRWIAGAIIGSLIIAITSPLFVRSYLMFQVDPIRGVPVLKAGDDYRWRSEGYATTRIGAMGMPAGPEVIVKKKAGQLRLALWGDSQAEGVCVDDDNKLHRQIERAADNAGLSLSVLPMARSGDDVSDWGTQIPRVEKPLEIDIHLLLVAELSDLDVERLLNDEAEHDELPPMTLRNRIVEATPAFLIQAVRRTLRNPDDTPRSLRFGVGPIVPIPSSLETSTLPKPREDDDPAKRLHGIIEVLAKQTNEEIIVAYAPNIPVGFAVNIESRTREDASLQAISRAADAHGITFIDMRESLLRSAVANRWPHGFHNGQFGAGHLNAVGFGVIADAVVDQLASKSNIAASR